MTMPLPETLLCGVAWSFTGSTFADVDHFSDEVRQYQLDICGEDSWRPDDVVLGYGAILVNYKSWKDDEEISSGVELKSENGKNFTAKDLLFKLHNAIVGDLADIDHHFLEGLTLNSRPVAGIPPLYLLRQGS